MANAKSARFVDRVQFFGGQPLVAGDLQALEEYQRQMRWLHNRSLHQPGVASGFAVRGNKGDPSLVVEPGYAIDALGRELILNQSHSEPVPPVAGDGSGNPAAFDLTVSYSSSQDISETRRAICDDATGAVRLSEAPVFCWVRVDESEPESKSLRQQLESGERILLARVQVLNCQLYQPVSIVERRNAKPSLHPFLYADTADVSVTHEKTAIYGVRLKGTVLTQAAGFRTSPAYFVNIVQPLSVEAYIRDVKQTVPIDGFLEISNIQPEGFDLTLVVPTYPSNVPKAAIENIDSIRIEWLGVEG